MNKRKSFLSAYNKKISEFVADDESRRNTAFVSLEICLVIVSLIMSVVNFFTDERVLMISTLAFAVLCTVNILLGYALVNNKVIKLAFAAESMALLAFFYITGFPDGFSALWICLIPSFALLIFGQKKGTVFSLTALAMMVFFFWIPIGSKLLQYSYSDTFMLRFPFLYCAIFGISLLIEHIRSETQNQLMEAKQQYWHLYRHDNLTGLYNRYGINEYMNTAFNNDEKKSVAVMMMDIDNFKKINDMHGHDMGDLVLKKTASILQDILCEHCQYCRWGGEEFLVIMQCNHDPVQMAEKIRKAVEMMDARHNDKVMHITISIGVCIVNDASKYPMNQIITEADKCMYESKEKGKNRTSSRIL